MNAPSDPHELRQKGEHLLARMFNNMFLALITTSLCLMFSLVQAGLGNALFTAAFWTAGTRSSLNLLDGAKLWWQTRREHRSAWEMR